MTDTHIRTKVDLRRAILEKSVEGGSPEDFDTLRAEGKRTLHITDGQFNAYKSWVLIILPNRIQQNPAKFGLEGISVETLEKVATPQVLNRLVSKKFSSEAAYATEVGAVLSSLSVPEHETNQIVGAAVRWYQIEGAVRNARNGHSGSKKSTDPTKSFETLTNSFARSTLAYLAADLQGKTGMAWISSIAEGNGSTFKLYADLKMQEFSSSEREFLMRAAKLNGESFKKIERSQGTSSLEVAQSALKKAEQKGLIVVSDDAQKVVKFDVVLTVGAIALDEGTALAEKIRLLVPYLEEFDKTVKSNKVNASTGPGRPRKG